MADAVGAGGPGAVSPGPAHSPAPGDAHRKATGKDTAGPRRHATTRQPRSTSTVYSGYTSRPSHRPGAVQGPQRRAGWQTPSPPPSHVQPHVPGQKEVPGPNMGHGRPSWGGVSLRVTPTEPLEGRQIKEARTGVPRSLRGLRSHRGVRGAVPGVCEARPAVAPGLGGRDLGSGCGGGAAAP